MTKKLLSLLVAFALLAMPCLTLAEGYQTYVSEDKSVTFLISLRLDSAESGEH